MTKRIVVDCRHLTPTQLGYRAGPNEDAFESARAGKYVLGGQPFKGIPVISFGGSA